VHDSSGKTLSNDTEVMFILCPPQSNPISPLAAGLNIMVYIIIISMTSVNIL